MPINHTDHLRDFSDTESASLVRMLSDAFLSSTVSGDVDGLHFGKQGSGRNDIRHRHVCLEFVPKLFVMSCLSSMVTL